MRVDRYLVRLLSIALLVFAVACSEPVSEAELLTRARAALDRGDAQAAELDVKTVLQENANNPAARRIYGEIYMFRINPEAAVGEFERALGVSEDPETRLLMAQSLVQAGNSAELVSEYEAGSYATMDSSPAFRAALARAYLAQADPETGSEVLAEIEAEGDDYVDLTRAVFALQVDKDVEAARALLLQLTERSPGSAHAWSLLGLIANSQNDRAAAGEYFGKAAEINPYRLGDRLEQVNALLRQGKSQAAAENLASLERLIPKYPEVNFMRGQLLFDEGRFKEAIDSFALVLQARPTHLGALLLSANANMQVGNVANAQRQLADFLSLQPGHLQASLQLGKILLDAGNPVRAEEVARTALMANDTDAGATELLAAALAMQGRSGESAQVYQELARMQPDSSQALVALGVQQVVAGESDDGIARLREAVALDPANPNARRRLIEAHLALGDTDAALAAARAFVEAAPDNPVSSIYLGRVYLQQEDFAAAGKAFDAALELDPGNALASSGVAAVAVANEDLPGARAAFEGALAVNPDDLSSSMNLAMVQEQEGDTQGMVQTMRAAMAANPEALPPRIVLARQAMVSERPGEAIDLLLPLQESAARDYRLWQVLTGAYVMVDQIEAAQGSVRKLLQLRPEDPAALALGAEVAARTGKPDEAQGYLERALEVAPDSEPLRQMLVQALVRQNKIEEAGEQLPFISDEAQQLPAILNLRGRLALMDGDAAAAEALFEQALAAERSNTNAVYLATARWQQGQQDEAVAGLQDWLRETPGDAAVRAELARLQLLRSDNEAARTEYEELVRLQPDNPLVLNNLAWLLRDSDPEQAFAYAERANELVPDNPQMMDTLAMIEMDRGNTQSALDMVNEALKLAPDAADIQLSKARILASAGRDTEARQLLTRLASGAPDPLRGDAQSLLDSMR